MKHNFEIYCKDYENIENYKKALADNFKGWCCHHRLETWNSDGKRRAVDITAAELQALGMYWNRPASELIFLTVGEHSSLHKPSEETKKKMREAQKGNKNALGCKRSTETRKWLSEIKKNMTAETRKKIGEAKKGMHFFNNGKINIRAKECPDGFTPGRIKKL